KAHIRVVRSERTRFVHLVQVLSGLSEVTRGLNRAEERVVDRLRKTIIIEAENHFALGGEAAHVVELRRCGEGEVSLRVNHAASVV
ncbi:hypothetical protein DVA69_19085, partial [Acinetobacter baumannii]